MIQEENRGSLSKSRCLAVLISWPEDANPKNSKDLLAMIACGCTGAARKSRHESCGTGLFSRISTL